MRKKTIAGALRKEKGARARARGLRKEKGAVTGALRKEKGARARARARGLRKEK
jgi:hypothetical protein